MLFLLNISFWSKDCVLHILFCTCLKVSRLRCVSAFSIFGTGSKNLLWCESSDRFERVSERLGCGSVEGNGDTPSIFIYVRASMTDDLLSNMVSRVTLLAQLSGWILRAVLTACLVTCLEPFVTHQAEIVCNSSPAWLTSKDAPPGKPLWHFDQTFVFKLEMSLSSHIFINDPSRCYAIAKHL